MKIITFILVLLLWYAYATVGKNPCERIDRGMAPIRTVMDVATWAAGPWTDDDFKFSMLRYEIAIDRKIREIVAKQIYRSDLVSLGCEESPSQIKMPFDSSDKTSEMPSNQGEVK